MDDYHKLTTKAEELKQTLSKENDRDPEGITDMQRASAAEGTASNADVTGTPKEHPLRKGISYILASSLGFSIIPILASLGFSANASPVTMLFYRFLIAGIVFFTYCFIRQRSFLRQSRKNTVQLVTAAIIYSIQCILFFSAFQYIPAALGEVIFYIYPVFVAALSVLFLKERMTRYRVVGILTALLGIFVVLYAPAGGLHLRGVLLVLLAALASSCYFIFNKKFTSEISAPVLMTYVCFTCSFLYLIYSLFTGEFTVPTEGKVWLYILLLALWSTCVGLFCLMQGLKLLSAGIVSLLSLAEPIFTILLSFLIFGTALTPSQLLGSGLVLVAIYIYEKN
ncbi:DMT family transporter [Aminipila butyrica]|uniref:DMT family transporter n=1 Tax=Aminipila butyrica TaxID=433296 RepID=A0A858BZ17_9FIRM|nr:DMT family transporter [Aminipila butyrica]QIB70348.1 DMT family transporter [Aminipila butyrica]